MARYNVKFELSVEDMDLIEGALRRSKSELSAQSWDASTTSAGTELAPMKQESEGKIRRIHELLGRLHNQKVFYRPKSAPYISG
ncbi:MAG: hypothetical protein AAF922_05535 [Pseudomonadota bacterium]